jgi:hypothetical protein
MAADWWPLHPRRARIVAVALTVYGWVVDRIRWRRPMRDLERLAAVLGNADDAYNTDLAELEGVDPDELAAWTHQPDPDTDGVEHD